MKRRFRACLLRKQVIGVRSGDGANRWEARRQFG